MAHLLPAGFPPATKRHCSHAPGCGRAGTSLPQYRPSRTLQLAQQLAALALKPQHRKVGRRKVNTFQCNTFGFGDEDEVLTGDSEDEDAINPDDDEEADPSNEEEEADEALDESEDEVDDLDEVAPKRGPRRVKAAADADELDELTADDEADEVSDADDYSADEDLDAIIGEADGPDADDLDAIAATETAADARGPSDEELESEEQDEELMQSYPEPKERQYPLSDLMEAAGYDVAQVQGLRDVLVCGLQHDPDKISPGDLYLSLPAVVDRDGFRFSGHLYVEQAVEKGAVAIVSDMELPEMEGVLPVVRVDCMADAVHRLASTFYGEPSKRMLTVGVTGTTGKSTTAWLIRGILEAVPCLTGMIGTIEYAIAHDKLTEDGDLWIPDEEDPTLQRECSTPFYLSPYMGKYRTPGTTPDALAMQKLLAGMADREATACVIECDPSALILERCSEVDFDIAVFTNISEEQMRGFEDLETYLVAMNSLFLQLSDPSRQRAVINIDDPYADDIRAYPDEKGIPVITYSMSNKAADVYINKLKCEPWESVMEVMTPLGPIELYSFVIGRHNVPNILAAIATGYAASSEAELGPEAPADLDISASRAGFAPDLLQPITTVEIQGGIEATVIVPGRCETIDEGQDFGVVVDSASNPEALSRLLDSMRECIGDTRAARIFLIFGCKGDEREWERPYMGEVAHYKADFVILTSDSPRHEQPDHIIYDVVAGFPENILEENAQMPFPPGFLQDPGRVPAEAVEFLWQHCWEYRRYVVEDRWTAIRWAIGTARDRDIVIIAGRGHTDYTEVMSSGITYRGWIDDRVEARNALSKLRALQPALGMMDHHDLPWIEQGERDDRCFNPDAEFMRP